MRQGLALAREHLIATKVVDHKRFATREAFDAELATVIDRRQPTLVVLAGFMRILTPAFVARYEGRLVNIHPSLLPAFARPAHTSAPLTPAARLPAPRCTRSQPNWTTGPSWRRLWCRCCRATPPRHWRARVLTQEHLIYPHAIAALLRDS
jgi:phosphoribosylglycinamide formyltransferase-1